MGKISILCLTLALFALLDTEATSTTGPAYLNYCVSILAGNQQPKTCLDLLCRGFTSDGVYTIYPTGNSFYSFQVYCDQSTDGGGWTVFQRRMDGSVDFYRNWYSYKYGFGNPNDEHWLGNDKLIDVLTVHASNELRVDLESVAFAKAYAKYSSFGVGDETTSYKLTVGGFSGTAGDSLTYHSGSKFSTRDRDNDVWNPSCATRFHGAWWYKACHVSNLNGDYLNGTHTSFADGVNWRTWKGYKESLKTTEMKIRGKL